MDSALSHDLTGPMRQSGTKTYVKAGQIISDIIQDSELPKLSLK